MSVINTNVMSLNAQRNLGTNSADLGTTIQRLSSGLRINSAKDDAAGLAISQRFTTQVRGMDQAARNANDGISLAQTAEGALGEIGNNLQRIRELAVQSRNATNSDSDRAALNAEVQLLKAEIQRVAEQTNFNGTKLLDGSFTNQAFQIGADQGQTINIAQIANANINELGNWNQTATSATATSVGATGTSGQASFAATTFNFSGANEAISFDVTVDGSETPTTVTLDGDYTDGAGLAAAIEGQLTGATVTFDSGSIVIASAATGESSSISISNVVAGVNAAEGAVSGLRGATAVDGSYTAGSFTLQGVLPSGEASEAITINYDAAGSASQRANDLVAAINNQTYNTGVTASLDKEGNVALSSANGNFTISGGADLTAQTGLTAAATSNFTEGRAVTGFAQIDISTAEHADNAILAMDAALNSVNSARADLGAIQNRFSSVVTNLQTSSENMSAARSRIMDADYAKETANLSRTQILQQAGTAMLAQANQSSQSVLSLLR